MRGVAMHGSDHLTKGAPPRLVGLVRRIESDERLDRPAGAVERLSTRLGEPNAHHVLSGAWLGHALHPLLTDFPLGTWMSATLLDLFGGPRSRPAAQGLVAFGLACTAPTIASGLVEWRAAGQPERRVGVLHGAMNSFAAACYAASLVPRARGHRVQAACWSVAGGLVATASGYLGGHLSLVRKVGSRDIELSRSMEAPP